MIVIQSLARTGCPICGATDELPVIRIYIRSCPSSTHGATKPRRGRTGTGFRLSALWLKASAIAKLPALESRAGFLQDQQFIAFRRGPAGLVVLLLRRTSRDETLNCSNKRVLRERHLGHRGRRWPEGSGATFADAISSNTYIESWI
jgi:hypothetical protein